MCFEDGEGLVCMGAGGKRTSPSFQVLLFSLEELFCFISRVLLLI